MAVTSGYFELEYTYKEKSFEWRGLFDEESNTWLWRVLLGEFAREGASGSYERMMADSRSAMDKLARVFEGGIN